MKAEPYAESHPTSWVLWPVIIATLGECECCGEIAALQLSLSFLCFEAGLRLTKSAPHSDI